MCGIFGEIGRSLTPEAYPAISARLRHRGPDADGFQSGEAWWLGFRRLAILDLSAGGAQPMATDDGRYWIVFNGEIYNYVELRRGLEERGVRFRGHSDTEVLLHLLRERGNAALELLNGMFALAFIDTVERRFLLARDRLGVKPFYWHAVPGRIRFASEMKGLLAWPDAPRTLDRAALAEFLSLGYLSNETSILEGYGKLPPGHYAVGSLDAPSIEAEPYWRPPLLEPGEQKPVAEEDLEELSALIEDAVRIRLRSDVPVAILLSGGIDSGLVASYASKFGSPLAVTVGFSEEAFDESDLAARTARHAGLEGRAVEQKPFGLGDLDRLAGLFDEPLGDPSALPMHRLCAAAREHGIVLLSGDGGDEAFGGYRRYIEALRRSWMGRLPGPIRTAAWWSSGLLPTASGLRYKLAKATLPDMQAAAVFDGQGLTRDATFRAILPLDLRGKDGDVAAAVRRAWRESEGLDLLTRQRALDYRLYLPGDVLAKVDRASMAHSTEVRSPFLDYRIVAWVAHRSPDALVQGGRGKMPLRRLAAGRLPSEVVNARKMGFGVPVGAWLREPAGKAIVEERLVGAGDDDLWDRRGVAEIFEAHRSGARDLGDLLWRLLVLDVWRRSYGRASV